tara:strand:- start:43 stop:300 length:258 start_codon:yes stop_codon:yes gene_type:complete
VPIQTIYDGVQRCFILRIGVCFKQLETPGIPPHRRWMAGGRDKRDLSGGKRDSSDAGQRPWYIPRLGEDKETFKVALYVWRLGFT